MKPDWKDAPDWAQYLTRDRSGMYQWWSALPKYESTQTTDRWVSSGIGGAVKAADTVPIMMEGRP